MSGLTEEQQKDIYQGLADIRHIKEEISLLRQESVDTKDTVLELQVTLVGMDKNNGLRKEVRANTERIQGLEKRPAEVRRVWFPIVISLVSALVAIGSLVWAIAK
jgi:hypothetical protein